MYSTERLKTILKTTPLVSYSGYSYRVIEDRWRNDPLSAIGALQHGGRYNAPGHSLFSIRRTAGLPHSKRYKPFSINQMVSLRTCLAIPN